MADRGKDPAEIDELLRVDEGARLAKTLVQNRQQQANIDTQLWELYAVTRKKPLTEEQKEQQAAPLRKRLVALQEEELPLRVKLNEWQQADCLLEIERLDREIAAKEAVVAECDRKQLELLEPLAGILEKIVEEIKAEDFFLQKGRGEGSTTMPRHRKIAN
jgi:hypothetical protein